MVEEGVKDRPDRAETSMWDPQQKLDYTLSQGDNFSLRYQRYVVDTSNEEWKQTIPWPVSMK